MFGVSEETRGHMIGHVSNCIISSGWYQKSMQTTFLEELMNILNKRQLCKRDIVKKVDDFF